MKIPAARSTWRFEVTLALAVFAALGGLGSVPGDVGGCGQRAEALDPEVFDERMDEVECDKCVRCSIATAHCREVCGPDDGSIAEFPAGCVPLVHDGEVCLRAIAAARCRVFAEYVDEEAPTMPTECDFCPQGEGK